jgi:hypothetical protein
VFADPDECANPEASYRVAYPNSWYSNSALEGIEACWMFAPTDFDVVYGTEIPAEVAIVIRRVDEWDAASFSGRQVLSDDPVTVDGLPARVQDVELTGPAIGAPPGHRIREYVVDLPEGDYLVAATYLGPDPESAMTVLDDMMRTIQIGLPSLP